MPVFSIIIPAFNTAAYLENALNSITSQSFDDYEIVIVDGASTDDTSAFINTYSKLHQNKSIKFFSEPDKGIYDAMNKGVTRATGDWVYFMGSDDTLYSNNVLDSIYKEIQKEPVSMIYGNVVGEGSEKHYVHDSLSTILSKGIHHQSIFYKRRVFEFAGEYDSFFKVSADYHLTLKIFAEPKFKTRYVNIDIAKFGEGGLSSRNFDYTLLSCHYKLLMQHNLLSKIEKPEECLDTSIYCSFYLLKEKKNMSFASKNLLYYATNNTHLNFTFRIKTILRMIYWTLKSA